MKLSLIMATVGRVSEVARFLAALDDQTHRDFELIVVDQNPDNRLAPLLDYWRERLTILHLRSDPGISHARNAGLKRATGEVVGFPDDDCWYPPQLLAQVVRYLHENPNIAAVTGRVMDEYGCLYARFESSPRVLGLSSVWQGASSVCAFFRSSGVASVGGFDETLGLGAGTQWGGGEDIDYPVRAIKAGLEVHYEPDLVVFHPNPLEHGYGEAKERAYSYGAGIGRVWRKHDYPLWLVAYYLLRPLGGALLSLATGHMSKARYHWSALRGRLQGWSSRN